MLFLIPSITFAQNFCMPTRPGMAKIAYSYADPTGRKVTDLGSGVVFKEDGDRAYVLTCFHIFRDGWGKGKAVVYVGTRSFQGRIINYNIKYDLVVILIANPKTKVIPIATRDLRNGEILTASGFVKGSCYREIKGRLVKLTPDNLVCDNRIYEGMSGGPLIDVNGYVVGVCWGTDNKNHYCAPLSKIRLFLKNVFANRRAKRNPTIVNNIVVPNDETTEDPPTEDNNLAEQVEANRIAIEQLQQSIDILTTRLDSFENKIDTLDSRITGEFTTIKEQIQNIQITVGSIGEVNPTNLPPIRIQTLKPDGTVHQDATAHLGDLIKLKAVPISGAQ